MIGEMRVEGNWRRAKQKKKWVKVIRKDMRVCGVNENTVRDKGGQERI